MPLGASGANRSRVEGSGHARNPSTAVSIAVSAAL